MSGKVAQTSQPVRVGIGGPVGSGKTALVEKLCLALRDHLSLAVVTNDIYTREDAEFLVRAKALEAERIIGVETGGCPHTAIREDASLNLDAIQELERRFCPLDLILVESGGGQLGSYLQPGAGGRLHLRHRRGRRGQDPAQRRAGDHPLRPAGDQQDRSGSLCGGRLGGDGTGCPSYAGR